LQPHERCGDNVQVPERIVERLFALRQLPGLCRRSNMRKGKEVVNEPLHSAGAVDRVSNVFVGSFVQLSTVSPLQQLQGPDDREIHALLRSEHTTETATMRRLSSRERKRP
jgi:hypothetical protein